MEASCAKRRCPIILLAAAIPRSRSVTDFAGGDDMKAIVQDVYGSADVLQLRDEVDGLL